MTSAVPEAIEPVHFDQPRAVRVREEGNLSEFHSAVSGRMNIWVETQTEADAIIAAWPDIMRLAADRANLILTEIRASNPPAEEVVT